MTFQELKQAIRAESIRARGLKTKKAQQRAWDKVRSLEREVLGMLYEARSKYAPYSIKATVQYFHDGDDHILTRTADGESCWISPTSDEVSKSWYGSTCCVSYSKGQDVVIEIEVDVDSDRLCLIHVPRRVRGGTLNEAKYAELCKRTDLAFFKYPSGMSGLFSSKGA